MHMHMHMHKRMHKRMRMRKPLACVSSRMLSLGSLSSLRAACLGLGLKMGLR